MAALVINGVFWTVDRNVKIHIAEEALSELKTMSSIQNIELSELKAYPAENAVGGWTMALQEGTTAQSNTHGIVLEDRKSMTLTGVKDVSDFNERKIVLMTEMGQLTITGRSLNIRHFILVTLNGCRRQTF